MQKIIVKCWFAIVGVMLVSVYLWGCQKMYFHQDDLDWFILANRPFWQVIQAPIGDHVNYLWRLLLSFEWGIFRLNFAPYLMISILIHGAVIWLIYKLAYATSKRRDLSVAAALIFTINTNWTETILWISGQTISITVLFVLIAMYYIWQKKIETVTIFLTGLTSALAIGLPIASLIVYGYEFPKKRLNKVGWAVIATLTIIATAYYFKGTDGTQIAFGFDWLIKVGQVMVLMLFNTVIGRLLVPFDRYELVRISLVSVGMVLLIWRYRNTLSELWIDKWCRFLLLQLLFYNLIVASGRAQFGVGIMRAERYAYLGLALTLLFIVRILRKTKIDKWFWLVPVVISLQIFSFIGRGNDYIARPQKLKNLITQIENGQDTSDREEYLPHFVLNDERLKYGDLYDLIKR